MKINFTIAPDGLDEYEVKAGTRDIRTWEKTTKGASVKGLMEDLHMGDLYKVAYYAAKRTGQFSGTLQEFEDQCDLEFQVSVEGSGESDPTQPAP